MGHWEGEGFGPEPSWLVQAQENLKGVGTGNERIKRGAGAESPGGELLFRGCGCLFLLSMHPTL